MPDFSLEQAYGDVLVAGVDEAGRGPLAGPVVAAAVILQPEHLPMGINDSKKLSIKKRNLLYQQIIEHHMYGVGVADVEEIDRLNILGATKLAMQRAVSGLTEMPGVALVDGNQPPELACEVKPVIKGDSISLSIAAASIIAKVTRDRMMEALDTEFPHYGWAANAGYGTKAHLQAITEHGVTPHHRRSFAPVRLAMETVVHA